MLFGGFLRQSNYNWKKRYSHLAVGWNKSQITLCRVKIRTPPITLQFKKILIGLLYYHTLIYKNSYWVSLFYRNNEIKTFCYCVSVSCFVWIYNLTVTIVSQKYREPSLQVEISE
jgi:hypothetical protein